MPVSECFHVRVLIPCYTEALEIVRPTLLTVANATLPKARAPRGLRARRCRRRAWYHASESACA